MPKDNESFIALFKFIFEIKVQEWLIFSRIYLPKIFIVKVSLYVSQLTLSCQPADS